MAEIREAGIKNIVASMMERQAEAAKAAPTGVVGVLWEKATGEIDRYNKAIKDQEDLKTAQIRTIHKMEKAQKRLDKLNREVAEGLHEEGEAAEKAAEQIEELTQEIEELHSKNEDLAESVNESTQKLEGLNKGGGILKNGLTVLAAKAAGAATAFFGFKQAIAGIDDRFRLAAKSLGDFGALSVAPTLDKTEAFGDVMFRLAGAAKDWHDAISASSWEMMKLGIGTEETKKIVGSYAEGLRLTTVDQHRLMKQTQQMTEDTGFLATMLRVNTDELASATVDASKRFGKSTQSMADDLAGLYYSFQGIKEASRGTVMNFGDLTRATLEAQASFQGYNFNLRSTANILGNVVAKAQEQGATYEMSMQAAKGLAGVLTGGKAPDWAKYIAGRDLRSELVKVVQAAKATSDDVTEQQKAIGEAIRKTFGEKLSEEQVTSLKKVAANWRKYGPLSSAKMTEEILRGTDKGMAAMFKQMKKHADKPEGREMLMRVWGIDEAAATAAVFALQSAKTLKDFTEIEAEAKTASALRKPPTVADLREQTGDFAYAIGSAGAGIMGSIDNMLEWLKQNPAASAAMGLAGTAGTVGLNILQTGVGEALGDALAGMGIGRKVAGVMRGAGRVATAPFRGAAGAVRGTAGAIRHAGTAAKMGTTLAVESAAEAAGKAAKAAGRAARTAGEVAKTASKSAGGVLRTAGTAVKTGSKIAVESAKSGAGAAVEAMSSAAGSLKGGLSKVATGMRSGMGRAIGTIARGASGLGATFGRLATAAGSAVGSIATAAANAAPALGGIGKAALPLLGKAGLVGLAAGAGAAVGSLIRLIPGVDKFTEGLINSTAGLLGFKKSLDETETAQAALNNQSEGITRAIQQMTEGVTTEFEKDSLKRMVAVRQLDAATDEDLKAYAKKIAERTELSEDEIMERLKKLRSEKVSNEVFLKRKRAEEQKVKELETPTPTPTVVPTGAMMVAMAPTVGAVSTAPVSPGMPTAPARRSTARRRSTGRTPEPTAGGVRVGPDGSIAMTLTIPSDAVAKSTAQTAGMSE